MSYDIPLWSVPRLWPGETVAIVAGGPNLELDQLEVVREAGWRCLVINKAYLLAPWADWLHACDAIDRFWSWHSGPDRRYKDVPDAMDFAGIKTALWSPTLPTAPYQRLVEGGVKILFHPGESEGNHYHRGFPGNPGEVHGNNGLFHSLCIAAHTGVARIVLLGVEMKSGHWHQPWPMGEPNYAQGVIPLFESLVVPFRAAGVEIVNCSPGSALTWWPMEDLQETVRRWAWPRP